MFQDTAFYLVLLLTAVVFTVGVAGNVAFWLSGVNAGGGTMRWSKVPWAVRRAVSLLFSGKAFKAFVSYGLIQRQLWEKSRLRWLMSVSFLWAAILLFFVGSLGDMFDHYGWLSISKDNPWFALTNEIAGLVLLMAVLIACYRRFIQKVPHLRTGWEATFILAWLAVIALTGYLVEAARLLAEDVTSQTAGYSFVGHGISHLGLGWDQVYRQLWWLHLILAFSLIAYVPYSKLFHAIVTPISIMAGVRDEANQIAKGEFSGFH